MAGKTKFFRVALEGATTDGRVIQRSWIEQMARNYRPSRYGARCNLEHIKGISPDSPFCAYGDVLALKAEAVQEEGGKLGLYAQIDPTDEAIALNRKRKKVYPSIEIDTEFADSGEAYLVGLAFTDTPASLGTDMLAFAAGAKVNPFASRKLRPENLFSAADFAIELELESDEDTGPGILDKVKQLFSRSAQAQAGRNKETDEAIELVASDQASLREAYSRDVNALRTEVDTLKADRDKDREAFAALREALSQQDGGGQRPAAKGGEVNHATDC